MFINARNYRITSKIINITSNNIINFIIFTQTLNNEDCRHTQNNKGSESTNYIIAEHINKYKVIRLEFYIKIKLNQPSFISILLQINQIFDLNSSLYSYEILCEPQILAEINETETTEVVVNFGKVSNMKKGTLPNVLVCWYKIQLSPDHVHDTKKNNSFMNHTAVILEDDLQDIILRDQEVKIKVYHMKGLVKIAILHL